MNNPAYAALGFSGNVHHPRHWNLYLKSDFTIPALMPYGDGGEKTLTKVGHPVRPFVVELPDAGSRPHY